VALLCKGLLCDELLQSYGLRLVKALRKTKPKVLCTKLDNFVLLEFAELRYECGVVQALARQCAMWPVLSEIIEKSRDWLQEGPEKSKGPERSRCQAFDWLEKARKTVCSNVDVVGT